MTVYFFGGILYEKDYLAITLFIIGLAVAQYFFDVDVEGLTEGFIDFLKDLFDGPG